MIEGSFRLVESVLVQVDPRKGMDLADVKRHVEELDNLGDRLLDMQLKVPNGWKLEIGKIHYPIGAADGTSCYAKVEVVARPVRM